MSAADPATGPGSRPGEEGLVQAYREGVSLRALAAALPGLAASGILHLRLIPDPPDRPAIVPAVLEAAP